VLRALEQSRWVGARVLCGLPAEGLAASPGLDAQVKSGSVGWMQGRPTPSSSVSLAFQALPRATPVLVTTADHVFLRGEIVDDFCSRARATGLDLVVALASYDDVMAAHPGTRRTALRFRGGAYCGCNLYAFMTPASRQVAAFWQTVEGERKRPWRVVRALGWIQVLRYVSGRLTLEQALAGLSRRLGVRVGYVTLPFPEAAVDVDSVADWDYARQRLEPPS
jgi:hypothetical protein